MAKAGCKEEDRRGGKLKLYFRPTPKIMDNPNPYQPKDRISGRVNLIAVWNWVKGARLKKLYRRLVASRRRYRKALHYHEPVTEAGLCDAPSPCGRPEGCSSCPERDECALILY